MTEPGTSKRQRLLVALGLVVSVIFIGLALHKIELRDVWQELGKVSLAILSLSLVTKLIGFCFMSWRSQLLLKPLHAYPFGSVLKSIFIAFIGNNVLPARMGELLRIHYLARKGEVAHSSCLAVLVLERLMDMCCLLLIFACTLPLLTIELTSWHSIALFAAAVATMVVTMLLISRFPERFIALCRWVTRLFGERLSELVTTRAERFAQGMGALSSIWSVLGIILMSLGYWTMTLMSLQIWVWAFGLSLPWYAPLVMTTFIAFGTMLPSSPGYVGTYHYFVITALGLFAVEPSRAASVALIGHAVSIIPFTLLGAPFVMTDILAARREREGAASS
ncbi:MAG: hypothetical protein CMH57_02405 [Myxococcales bacterium]|nr:hypothetical protein [Myxococcales bacterium]